MNESTTIQAVQDDLDNNNEILCDYIIRIENKVPHCTAKTIAAEQGVANHTNAYSVDANGKLKQIS